MYKFIIQTIPYNTIVPILEDTSIHNCAMYFSTNRLRQKTRLAYGQDYPNLEFNFLKFTAILMLFNFLNVIHTIYSF